MLRLRTLFNPSEIEPFKVIASIVKVTSRAEEGLLPVTLEDEEADFMINLVLHEHGQIHPAVAIEVAALKEGIDAAREIELELLHCC